jgi:hypothetical protein
VVCVETNLTNLGAAAELALDMVDVGSLCNQCGDTELGDDCGTAVDIETDLTKPDDRDRHDRTGTDGPTPGPGSPLTGAAVAP